MMRVFPVDDSIRKHACETDVILMLIPYLFLRNNH